MIAPRQLVTIHGKTVRVPDRQQLVHLQFRRFAGCPVCNFHLHSVIQRHADIQAAAMRAEFGVGSSPRALLNWQVWLPIIWGVARNLARVIRKQAPTPHPNQLIAPSPEKLVTTTTQTALDGGETVKRLLLFTRGAPEQDSQA